ncbi:hypothetical protein BH09PSE5_BH09PSE5_50370 [soil metagenome]
MHDEMDNPELMKSPSGSGLKCVCNTSEATAPCS